MTHVHVSLHLDPIWGGALIQCRILIQVLREHVLTLHHGMADDRPGVERGEEVHGAEEAIPS